MHSTALVAYELDSKVPMVMAVTRDCRHGCRELRTVHRANDNDVAAQLNDVEVADLSARIESLTHMRLFFK